MGVFLLPCAIIDRATAAKNAQMGGFSTNYGTPDTIRTYDLWLRKPTLYPTELRVHICGSIYASEYPAKAKRPKDAYFHRSKIKRTSRQQKQNVITGIIAYFLKRCYTIFMADKQKKSGLKPKLQKAKAKFFKTYYSNPAKDLKIIVITGTNGRDITAHYMQEIIKLRDSRVGLVIDPKSTSDLYKQLFKIWKTGTDYAVVSADSHALANHLFYGMPIHAAVITDDINNSAVAGAESDDAKAILFNTKPDFSILSRDDANYHIFVEYPSKTATFSYGRSHDADLKVVPGKIYKQGAEATLTYNGERFDVATYITDQNSSYYMAAAATTAFALGFRSDNIVDGIANYEPKEIQTTK